MPFWFYFTLLVLSYVIAGVVPLKSVQTLGLDPRPFKRLQRLAAGGLLVGALASAALPGWHEAVVITAPYFFLCSLGMLGAGLAPHLKSAQVVGWLLCIVATAIAWVSCIIEIGWVQSFYYGVGPTLGSTITGVWACTAQGRRWAFREDL